MTYITDKEEESNNNPSKPIIAEPEPVFHSVHLDPNKVNSLGQRLKFLAQHIGDDDCKFQFDEIFEMARVEGYDGGSYIVTSLKEIRTKISNKELKPAATKISEILGFVMPFDYQQFFELFEATKDTAKRLSGKVCWVLLGPTG